MAERTINANDYEFSIDTETGTTTVRGNLQSETAARGGKVGVPGKLSTDHEGHLVAARANGPAIPENLHAQDRQLNQGTYKRVENAEQRLLADNATIQTERIAFTTDLQGGRGERPSAFMVNDRITYADGQTQDVHLSFANMTVNEQENINQSLDAHVDMLDVPNPGDTLRDSMSSMEYANLMENTDSEMPGIREEFEEQISMSMPMESAVESDLWDFDNAEFTEATNTDPISDWSFDASIEAEADIGEVDTGAEFSMDDE